MCKKIGLKAIELLIYFNNTINVNAVYFQFELVDQPFQIYLKIKAIIIMLTFILYFSQFSRILCNYLQLKACFIYKSHFI